jgi:energy coupling factor transporter S component ThiW
MTNVIAGVLLGPWYAALAATIAATLRNALGVGTPLAFPGSIPGALVVGFAYRIWRREWVGLLEPIGTGPVGAGLGALLVAPVLMGTAAPLVPLLSAFLASSIPGAIVGYIVLKALIRVGGAEAVVEGGR